MRQLYQRNRHGKKFGLSQDKYDLLKKLDFQFEIEDLPERFAFDERYKWLVGECVVEFQILYRERSYSFFNADRFCPSSEYKEQHGHVNVPQR